MSNMQLTVVLKTLSKTITITLALFFSFSLVSLNSFADATNIPNKGMTQSEVKTNFGEPVTTKAPIGNPPIERWDYPNYSVYFEGSYVIHSFFHNQRKQAVTPQVVTNNTEAAAETITVEQVPVEPASEAKADVMTEEKLENAAAQEEPVVEEVQVAEPMTEQTSEAAQQAGEATEAEAEAEMVEEAEKDLNFEEAETKTDYGKWGY